MSVIFNYLKVTPILGPVTITVPLNTFTNGTGTNISINYPAGIQAGDFLVIAGSMQNATATTPSGWTADDSTAYRFCATKIADGTETGAVTFTLSASVQYVYCMHVVRPSRPATPTYIAQSSAYNAGTTAEAVAPSNVVGKYNVFLYHAFWTTDKTISTTTSNITQIRETTTGPFGAFYYGIDVGGQTVGITVTTNNINYRINQYTFE